MTWTVAGPLLINAIVNKIIIITITDDQQNVILS